MFSPSARARFFFRVFLYTVSLILFLILLTHYLVPKPNTVSSLTVLNPPRPLTETNLSLSDGRMVSRFSELNKKVVVLYFGFVECPDVCPTTMAKLAKGFADLSKEQQSLVQVLFISVDPSRDTADSADAYAKSFNSQFLGTTAPSDQLQQLSKQLATHFQKMPPPVEQAEETSSSYKVHHSDDLFFISETDAWVGLLRGPVSVEEINGSLAQLLVGQ